ncbi:MAG TPA: TonB-dependent receptor [Kofleriaceae bacterium]|nr:TonB-dependent receptor [Kofleriaceae bacterium]
MKKLACSVSIILIGAAPVAASPRGDAPRSLRMRLRARPHVAQAPAPDPAPAGDAQAPSGDPAQPAPAPDQAGEPAPPAPEPAPAASATAGAPEQPGLTDAELAKLAEQEAKTEVITVTGSLIGRKEVDSPSPVSVVDKEKLTSAGITNVGDILQKIPAQGNAINGQNNNGGDGSTRISLRSLGARRTLVLMNGRRVVSSGTGADDSVDIGTIPLAMIERVEVLKDGASAIYGSDAVAGVVNIITRSNFNGTEAAAYTSTSQKGDGTNYDLSFVTGRSSARGNVTFAAGYQKQSPVMASDRKFSATTSTYNYTCSQEDLMAGICKVGGTTLQGSVASPTGYINTLTGPGGAKAFTPAGCTADVCTADVNHPGTFRNFVDPTATMFGDAYNFQTLNYVVTPSSRVNLFGNGSYELAKNTQGFFEASFNSRKSNQQLAEEPLITSQTGNSGIAISKDSIYNPFGADVTDYNRRLTEFGVRTADQDIATTRLVVGAKGSIDEDIPVLNNWKWETSYNYGRSTSTQTLKGDLIVSHLVRALGPSFVGPDGPTCGTPSAPITDGCVPLNLFTPGQVAPDAIKYLTFTSIQSGLNEQHTAQATASGKLVDLPNHGDVSLAFGGDYRFERGANTPDPLTATGDTTGSVTAPTAGSYHAFEGFGELSIVPVSGLDYLKWVEIDAAGRAYDYNTFGSGVTGKLSGLVRTAGGVAVRGTYGTAFRAPNITELFAGQADAFLNLKDPCNTDGGTMPLTGTTAQKCRDAQVPDNFTYSLPQIRGRIGGNPKLDPETAKIGTVGVVYEPLKGFDVTLDYWHIGIDHALQTLPASTILAQCYQGGIDEFCHLIERDPATSVISHLVDLVQNVGSLATSGLDFSSAYQYRNSLGTFRHAIEGTYLFKYNIDTGTIDPETGKEQILHGRNFFDLGVNPDLKVNAFTIWSHPSGIGAGFNARFVDSFQECDQNNCNKASNLRREVSSYATGDVFFNYGLKTSQGTTSVSIGVNNVVNAQPPAIYNGPALNADESAYDFMGRQFYVRLGQLF